MRPELRYGTVLLGLWGLCDGGQPSGNIREFGLYSWALSRNKDQPLQLCDGRYRRSLGAVQCHIPVEGSALPSDPGHYLYSAVSHLRAFSTDSNFAVHWRRK